MPKLDDQAQTRLALASLVVALVQTLGEQDKSVPSTFAKKLERLYRDMESHQHQPIQAMETIYWAKNLIQPN